MAPKRKRDDTTLTYNPEAVYSESLIMRRHSLKNPSDFLSEGCIRGHFNHAGCTSVPLFQHMLAIAKTANLTIEKQRKQIINLRYCLLIAESWYMKDFVCTYDNLREDHFKTLQNHELSLIAQRLRNLCRGKHIIDQCSIIGGFMAPKKPELWDQFDQTNNKIICDVCKQNFEDGEVFYRHDETCSGIFHKSCMYMMIEVTKTDEFFMTCPSCYRGTKTCVALVYSREKDQLIHETPDFPTAIFKLDEIDQTNIPTCRLCATNLELKRNRLGSFFWGCPNFKTRFCKTTQFAIRKPQEIEKDKEEETGKNEASRINDAEDAQNIKTF